MALLQNKIFALIVCLVAFIISGLIFSDKAFGVGGNVSVSSVFNMGGKQIISLGSPTDTSPTSLHAVNVSYLNSAGYLNAVSNVSWAKLNNFPSACSSGQYVSAVGSSLTCSTPSVVGAWRYLSNGGEYGYASPNSNNFFVGNSGKVLVGSSQSQYSSNLTVANSIEIQSGSVTSGGTSATFNVNYYGDLTIGNTGSRDIIISTDHNSLSSNITIDAGSVLTLEGSAIDINNGVTIYGNANIQGTLYASTKNFIIDHPLDPENKQLVHSSLEGPEVGVYYRGEGQLQNGKAEVVLPSYFEVLTRKENRTVLLTSKFDSNEPISNLAASAVENGKFQARAIDQNNPSQKFYWEVKAVRADIAPLEVERLKTEIKK